jgi:molecular chaperone GrpE (heat shock protein)
LFENQKTPAQEKERERERKRRGREEEEKENITTRREEEREKKKKIINQFLVESSCPHHQNLLLFLIQLGKMREVVGGRVSGPENLVL